MYPFLIERTGAILGVLKDTVPMWAQATPLGRTYAQM